MSNVGIEFELNGVTCVLTYAKVLEPRMRQPLGVANSEVIKAAGLVTEEEHDHVLEDRDTCRDFADELAVAIGGDAIEGDGIDPWKRALEMCHETGVGSLIEQLARLKTQRDALQLFFDWCYTDLSFPSKELRRECQRRMRETAAALGKLHSYFPGDNANPDAVLDQLVRRKDGRTLSERLRAARGHLKRASETGSPAEAAVALQLCLDHVLTLLEQQVRP